MTQISPLVYKTPTNVVFDGMRSEVLGNAQILQAKLQL
jgi:hypothetical protein